MNTLFRNVVAAPRGLPDPVPAPVRPLAKVFVRDLVLPAEVGVYAHEHGRTQRIRVNLDLAVLDRVGPVRDEIADVVSYEDAVNIVAAIVAEGHVKLIETLAERVAERLLTDVRIQSATIRVEKLDAFQDCASVGIEITRARS